MRRSAWRRAARAGSASTRSATRSMRQATKLAERFEAAFWCEDIGTYALALDGQKRPCRVRTSNAGQVLFSGIAAPERAEAVMRDLMRPSFFSGWGIRTVAREERRYNPMSYHNGSVWPHDNSLIAAGFARYGHKSAIDRVFKGLFDAASYMDLRRLPELYCGFQRGRQRGPTLYPVACSPQAWAAGTPLLLLQSSLGLEFDPDRNEILLRNPRLPPFLEEVTLRNLRLGNFVGRLDAAPARQRRVAPGVAQRRAYPRRGGLFVAAANVVRGEIVGSYLVRSRDAPPTTAEPIGSKNSQRFLRGPYHAASTRIRCCRGLAISSDRVRTIGMCTRRQIWTRASASRYLALRGKQSIPALVLRAPHEPYPANRSEPCRMAQ